MGRHRSTVNLAVDHEVQLSPTLPEGRLMVIKAGGGLSSPLVQGEVLQLRDMFLEGRDAAGHTSICQGAREASLSEEDRRGPLLEG